MFLVDVIEGNKTSKGVNKEGIPPVKVSTVSRLPDKCKRGIEGWVGTIYQG